MIDSVLEIPAKQGAPKLFDANNFVLYNENSYVVCVQKVLLVLQLLEVKNFHMRFDVDLIYYIYFYKKYTKFSTYAYSVKLCV